MTEEPYGYIQQVSAILGVEDPTLRLTTSIILGYPLAYFYRQLIFSKDTLVNHLFIISSGLFILYFNYGTDLYHAILAVFVSYILTHSLKGSILTTVTFVFHFGYLLIGYYYTTSDTYDIKWTMPHCVLILRLIGLSFDIADGQQPMEQLSNDNKQTCLSKPPNLLEIYSFALFPASLLVGPHFSFRRYTMFINKEFSPYYGNMRAGLTRGGIGILLLATYFIGIKYFSEDFLLSQEYANSTYVYKLLILCVWVKIVQRKYISVWLLAEGAATCFGLTFVSAKDGKEDWSGCADIKLYLFENCSGLRDMKSTFHVTINQWLAKYIYKRLKFLNNRNISLAAVLLFLALWHGFHTGYYTFFLIHPLIVIFENEIESIFKQNETFMRLYSTKPINWICFAIIKFYVVLCEGWIGLPFVMFNLGDWWHMYCTLRFFGLILFVPWPLYRMILKKFLPPTEITKGHSKTS